MFFSLIAYTPDAGLLTPKSLIPNAILQIFMTL